MSKLLVACFLAAPLSAQAPPIAKIVVTPAIREVPAGDTVQFSAQALDAAGRPLTNARIRFGTIGGEGGDIDSTGRLIAATTGVLPISVTALVPGERPRVERIEIRLVAGPAAHIAVRPVITRLVTGQRVALVAKSHSRAGDERQGDAFQWSSSAPNVVRVSEDGVLRAARAGRATVTVRTGAATATIALTVVPNTIATLELVPAAQRARAGDVVRFSLSAKDRLGRVIAGLSPTWTMAGGDGLIDSDGAFVAYQPGRYLVSASLGSRSVEAIVTVEERDVRRPVNVVGRLPRTEFPTAEVWLHPNGKVAYLGSHGGGDRFWTIDISNPAKPVVVDSAMMNTRLINDIMTNEAGTWLVATREGADNRQNGVVVYSLEDPLRPRRLSEFTTGVTAGVHSAYVYTDPKYGPHIYLTNDGTGAVHVLSMSDPANPKQVAVWKTPRADAGRYLHDVDVRDGLLYGSWWNDGLVILDVGNGIKGGSPNSPVLVSQYKYDLNAMYKNVEIESGAGHTRGTHTAWRHKNYVFIADEVYRANPVKGAKDAAADRMYGNLQVIDVSDILNPKAVAWYKPEYGGVHNVWVAGDTLYFGAYNGGFHAFDISGELRGDLMAQGRQIAHVYTGDMDGHTKNQAQTWGVVVNPKDGLAYVNDFFNGLWIVRIEPRQRVVP
jgi:hypothetical protein